MIGEIVDVIFAADEPLGDDGGLRELTAFSVSERGETKFRVPLCILVRGAEEGVGLSRKGKEPLTGYLLHGIDDGRKLDRLVFKRDPPIGGGINAVGRFQKVEAVDRMVVGSFRQAEKQLVSLTDLIKGVIIAVIFFFDPIKGEGNA